MLDLLVLDLKTNDKLIKRVNLMRTLGDLQIHRLEKPQSKNSSFILITYFTSESQPSEMSDFIQGLKNQTFLIYIKSLYIAFLPDQSNESNNTEKFRFLKEIFLNFSQEQLVPLEIVEINNLNYSMYFSKDYLQLFVIKNITSKIALDNLVLMIPACGKMSKNFLERVNLNTIQGEQVFFPIPFQSYMPTLSRSKITPQTRFSDTLGYFNDFSFEFAAFYNSDFKLNEYTSKTNLLDLFKSRGNLTVMRATDFNLVCSWSLVKYCEKPKMSTDEEWRCKKQRDKGLGTKNQLFNYLSPK